MNNQSSLKFKLFADCIPVKGYIRSAIYDLNRNSYKFVPNSMLEFVNDAIGKSPAEIKEIYGIEYREIVDEYIDFLEKNEFVSWLPEILLERFVPLDLRYDYPAYITNAILDIDSYSVYSVTSVLKQLENLGCKSVQIRSFVCKSIDYFDAILKEFITSSYLAFEIITMFSNDLNELEVNNFIQSHSRIKSIVFHTSPYNKIINQKGENIMGTLAFTKQRIQSPRDCHNNSEAYFTVSISLFSESLSFHPYFNRKVSIDTCGNIKNCSAQDKVFGNIDNRQLIDVINRTDFQELWNVSRDKIVVCKDCEFRYMCNDSTTPTLVSEDVWKLKKECDYNPYIAKWKGEQEYLTVEQFQQINVLP
jgi:SPASM domain peptide maturase of grasp-with-spasm system